LTGLEIAVVGMAGRFPGARDLTEFWRNLRAGREAVRFPDLADFAARGLDLERLADPTWVKAFSRMDGFEDFDDLFFGINPREAELMDPQHRVFLECAWEALESAGYDPGSFTGRVGVYGGATASTYLLFHLARNSRVQAIDPLQLIIGNSSDSLTTRVSYKLNLRGPSHSLQCACSTSLVAVHTACQSLLNEECDMALAGGVSIQVDSEMGYRYVPGSVLSPDGHCRVFDAAGQGCIFGSGVGLVVLKRLEEALADRDTIHAVILGSAVNNDGSVKVGFTAPGVEGQAAVISEALSVAGIDPATVAYVETHGTGTALGDPIEIQALGRAFREYTDRKSFCAIGSVKSNIGHLDVAAGVAGLIKTVLSLENGEIPPSLNFDRPNPKIDFASAPVYVNTRLTPWGEGPEPRRAGVSAFGVGGTNAHVVLEQAPAPAPALHTRPAQLLLLSARTPGALQSAGARLAAHLAERPGLDLASFSDIAHTLAVGRRAFGVRQALVCVDAVDAAACLEARDPKRLLIWPASAEGWPESGRPLAFVFPSQGAQHPGMGRDLYESEPIFRGEVDRAAAFLLPRLGLDLRQVLYPAAGVEEEAAARLARTAIDQPGLIAVEIALARLLESWGVRPKAMLGHGLGELAAAVLAGVFTFEEALDLVAEQGRWVEAGPEPRMEPFRARVAAVGPRPPKIPFLSSLTGTWIRKEEAVDPGYWTRQLCQPVRFSTGVEALLADPATALLEVGPGARLGHLAAVGERPAVAAMRQPQDMTADSAALLGALGQLWTAGVKVDWQAFSAGQGRHRVPLPTYPFERRRHWVEATPAGATAALPAAAPPEAPRQARPVLRTRYVAPRNLYEREVAKIWEEVLGVAQVGVEDNFYELGGHSLLATQVASRLREVFEAELPLQPLLEAITVAESATILRGALGSAEESALRGMAEPAASRIQPRSTSPDTADRAPLSFSQERMWFLDQLDPGTPIYNLFNFVEVSGPLAVPVLQRSMDEVVRRHEALRTVFTDEGGRAMQRILPAASFPMPVVDLAALPATVRRPEMARLEAAEHGRSFDLSRGPLLRMTLLSAGPNEHAVLFTMHHILSDGWSWVVLVREIAALYEAFVAGRPSPLPPLAIQYSDFAAWQREWLQGETLEAHVEYWRRQLGAAPPPLHLPTDRPRSALHGFLGGSLSRLLPVPLSADLKALADREGATLFMLLLAAFETLLYRYTGEEDLLVGVPIANRNHREIEGLIGFFLNTLVFRTELSGGLSFRDLLGRVRQAASGAYAHQDLPLESVLQAVHGDRHAGAPPFSVMFQVQNLPEPRLEFAGITLEASRTDLGNELATDIFDLCLVMEPGERGIEATAIYNARLFESATIERLLAQLETLLAGIARQPEAALDDLPLASPEEREEVLAWAASQVDAIGLPVHLAFAEQAERTPDAVALVAGEEGAEQLSYGELLRRIHRLAHYLRSLGVGPETPVGLCLERSLEMVVGLLAILETGGAYVPLDPAYPRERLDHILADTALPVLVTERHLLGVFGEVALSRVQGVCLDADRASIAACPGTALGVPVTGEGLAYVIYTSGSTGRPKGVMVRHGSLGRFVGAARALYGLRSADRVLQFASISFDTSAEEIYPCLTAGATLVLRGDAMLRSSADFLDACRARQVTLLDLPTAYWHGLAADLISGRAGEGWPPALRGVILGGERVLPERADAWSRQVGPGVSLWNTYGPTEGTIVATAYDLGSAPTIVDGLREVPMGRPLVGARAYVLDAPLEPAPVGVPGELCLGGAGVARGYLGRPELTAERFLPDPFALEAGLRLYRTGDLVRWRPGGDLEFLGRIDRQVKVRGFRIELGEIEAALAAHPAVREVAVLAREDTPGERRLVAYVTSPTERETTPGELRAFLAERLPEHMVPAAFVTLAALPLTGSGKVDRRALPAPDASRPTLAADYIAPRTPAEEAVAAIWCEVLGLERVGIHDDFYDLGGHSLLLPQVMYRLRRDFEVEVPLRSLAEETTVAGLALTVEELLLEQIERELALEGGEEHEESFAEPR
jgi:amino acid adenylation domain-containing protein